MKARRIEFHPDFSDDLVAAAEYFIKKVPGRVEDLLDDYDKTLDDVIARPELYAIREDDGLRRANLETFSYSIRYEWSDGVLSVVAFAHHHRDTARWIHRLAEIRRR